MRNMETKTEMKMENAKEWVMRAEETLYDAEMEFNNAAKGKPKKEAKEVFEWAQKQLIDASSAVLRAEFKLDETSDKEVTADEKETSKEE